MRPDQTVAFDLMGGDEIRAWMEEMGEYRYLLWSSTSMSY